MANHELKFQGGRGSLLVKLYRSRAYQPTLSLQSIPLPSFEVLSGFVASISTDDRAMWQLTLLSQVVPAFGALAKEFMECDNLDASLSVDAQGCYSDMVNIALAVSSSRGEWAFSLDDEVLDRLLDALDTRLPSRWKTVFSFNVSSSVCFFIRPAVWRCTETHSSLDDH